MKLTVKIEMDNDAFTDEAIEAELTRIFALIVARATCSVKGDGAIKLILDINGNICGRWSVKD